jgi:hypothetical protein
MFDKGQYRLVEEQEYLRVSPLPSVSELSEWYQTTYHQVGGDCLAPADTKLSDASFDYNMARLVATAIQQIGPALCANVGETSSPG